MLRPFRPADEQLLNIGLRGARFAAHRVAVQRRIAPAENGQALLLRNAFEDSFALQAVVFFHRQKAHGHAIGARLGQRYSQFAAFLHEKLVRNLDQDAGAVARLRVATRGAAMGEVDQHLKALADNLVALFALDAGHKPHAAGIVLIARVIETLRLMSAETIDPMCSWQPFSLNFVQCRCFAWSERHIPQRFVLREIALVLLEDACLSRSGRVRD